jgi:C4-dicarboxylate transporter, DctM subunit
VEYLAVATLFVLLLVGLPIGHSLGIAGLFLLYVLFSPDALIAVPQRMFSSLNSSTLMAVPFFILAADIMVAGGLTRHLINAAQTMLGHVRGGLATVAVASCAFFSAISGSSAATAVAVGSVLIPEMSRQGYNKMYSAGLIAVAGGLGILIPPSIPLIVYGAVAEQSVRQLFLAALIPGIILTFLYVLVGMHFVGKDVTPLPKAPWSERKAALKKASWIIAMPVVIMGLIYGGIATPTEAAALSVAYALFCAVFVYKDLKPRDIPGVLARSAGTNALILFIIAGASVFAYTLTLLRIPQNLTAQVLSADLAPWMFLIIVNIILLILGAFLDIISILLLTAPIVAPIMFALGVDPIHFAIIFVVNMNVALITPPLGLHLFILSDLTKMRVTEVFRGVLPFTLTDMTMLVIVTSLPILSLLLIR